MTFYDFSINRLNGQPFDLSQFRGSKVLLVNVASECGFTPQYDALEDLYDELKGKGVVVIGAPCNDFGAQEPDEPEQIARFCSTKFGVTFPLTEKIHCTGPEIHALYKWLTGETGKDVTWNFQKFLIDEEGKVVKTVAPDVVPTDSQITDWLIP